MAGPSNAECHIAVVEIICTEHLQRTLLMCDEATAFQRVVSERVASSGGKWTFEQYDFMLRHVVGDGDGDGDARNCRNEHLLALLREAGGERCWGGITAALRRREEFMQKEGLLLRRIAVAAKGIRRSGASLYPWCENQL
ncbi:hypothetical protein DPX39_100063400 [Trypanosoma brucei equiperdum]|uniref:Uncharacterized protein n=1 Tax=Trypanosoma brucei equiperdum TaxID=630700 RepID=A0A3L6KW35_9TRYP|nr:hypothetical protein DPX39_100063400 [Trypanosoma brucei equiperdum]